MPKTKPERFALFIDRLKESPAAVSAEAAIGLIADTLNAVEDEFSGVPYAPETRGADGRMYPAQMDNFRASTDPDVMILRHLAHRTCVRNDGAFAIIHVTSDRVEISKSGATGIPFVKPFPLPA